MESFRCSPPSQLYPTPLSLPRHLQNCQVNLWARFIYTHMLWTNLLFCPTQRRQKTSDDRKESKEPTEFLEGRQKKINISSLQFSFLIQFNNVPIYIAAPVLPLSTFTDSPPQNTANAKTKQNNKKKSLIFIQA